MGKKKERVKKGKKKRKNRVPSKKWESYSKNKRICPKCGPGVFLAEHKDRLHCGKCGYTEFKKQDKTQDSKQ